MKEVKKTYVKHVVAGLGIFVLGLGVYAVVRAPSETLETRLIPETNIVSPKNSLMGDEAQSWVLEYLKAHISELSPQKEVLGGKFYITKITFENSGNAVVEYEDGHIALKAHVSFILDGGKNVEVLKWDMLPLK